MVQRQLERQVRPCAAAQRIGRPGGFSAAAPVPFWRFRPARASAAPSFGQRHGDRFRRGGFFRRLLFDGRLIFGRAPWGPAFPRSRRLQRPACVGQRQGHRLGPARQQSVRRQIVARLVSLAVPAGSVSLAGGSLAGASVGFAPGVVSLVATFARRGGLAGSKRAPNSGQLVAKALPKHALHLLQCSVPTC